MKYILSFCVLLLVALSACSTQQTAPEILFTPMHLLAEDEISQTLVSLTTNQRESLQYISQHPDSRFIIPLLDVYESNPDEINTVLQTLTNQTLTSLTDWKNFCERNNIATNEDYTQWKTTQLKLHSAFIPDIETTAHQNSLQHIYVKKTMQQTPKALTNPTHVESGKRIEVTVSDKTKGYNFTKLVEHTVINDKIGETYLAITYCEICSTPVVYNTTQIDGSHFTFNPTNLAYQDNTLILDAETKTLWNAVTGYPVMGFLADQDIELDILGFTVVE